MVIIPCLSILFSETYIGAIFLLSFAFLLLFSLFRWC